LILYILSDFDDRLFLAPVERDGQPTARLRSADADAHDSQ
jgi:hypothetical protein